MSEQPLPARACRAMNKAGGPCRSRTVGVDGWCSIHRPGVDPVEMGRAGGLRSGEVRRDQAKTVRERLRQKCEENIEVVWAAFESGLASTDPRTRLTAALALLNEAYGQAVTWRIATAAHADGNPLSEIRRVIQARISSQEEAFGEALPHLRIALDKITELEEAADRDSASLWEGLG